jgi:alkanesulfonate monooxygenase SsuD/methylene tetrahydromethanopterin reductase-like flavin-dependent oxidoreductase (luciferase family)
MDPWPARGGRGKHLHRKPSGRPGKNLEPTRHIAVSSASVTPRPFRFGLQAMHAESGREWRDLARRTEGLGYSTLFVADHYLGPGPVYDRSPHLPQNLAPIAAIATAAEATEQLRVGCRVFAVDFHVPAVLAAETATLDLLSDGRL